MNYIGSKKKLLPFIEENINTTIDGGFNGKVFCDLFAGTGIVGRHFKKLGCKIISNDLEYYSYILNKTYVGNNTLPDRIEEYIRDLNSLPIISDGFIYKNYCLGGHGERMYFSDHNGKKIDTIRKGIENWYTSNVIDEVTYHVLLCSLIESSDKVANTASVYGAYLKKIKKSADKELILKCPEFIESEYSNIVFNRNSNDIIKEISGDILYLDPPYNNRQYGSNYHILNTISLYDTFIPKGKTGLRDYNKSKYCNKKQVLDEFRDLIKNSDFKYIFLSYNNEGLISTDEVKEVFEQYGIYKLYSKDYQRFKSDSNENRSHKFDSTKEYLHVLIRS